MKLFISNTVNVVGLYSIRVLGALLRPNDNNIFHVVGLTMIKIILYAQSRFHSNLNYIVTKLIYNFLCYE